MKLHHNFTSLYIYRLCFLIGAFLIVMFLHSQLLEYQQNYMGSLAQLRALQPALIEDTANVAQAEAIISELGKITNYYLFLIFGVVPLMLLGAYILFEWLFWKNFLGASGRPFFLRFLAVSIAGMILLAGLLAFFWSILNFENYSFDMRVLWLPVIVFLIHYFLLLIYFGLHAQKFKAISSAFNTGFKKVYIGLPLSVLPYLFFLFAWYGFFIVYTHFQQQIVRVSTYIASIAVLASIAAGIFLTNLFYEKFYLRYFSIKK